MPQREKARFNEPAREFKQDIRLLPLAEIQIEAADKKLCFICVSRASAQTRLIKVSFISSAAVSVIKITKWNGGAWSAVCRGFEDGGFLFDNILCRLS